MNPYRRVGQVATGDRFVERPALTRSLLSAWTEPGRPSNLCVLGHHRTGKTSLVKHAVAQPGREDLLAVWVDVGSQASGPDLFRAMVKGVLDQAAGLDGLHELAAPALATDSWYQLHGSVTAFFTAVRRAGKSVLVVLDEFDRAAVVCQRLAEFQLLRNLASEPQYPVGLLTISRRRIKDIEINAAGGSILDAVVSTRRHVGMFTATEAGTMLGRAALAGLDLTPVRERITDRSGLHPFLLETFCNGVVEVYEETGELSVDAAYERVMDVFHTQFEHLVDGLRTDGGARAVALLRQLAEGAVPPPPSLELNRFQRMGLAGPSAPGAPPRLFSPEFARYVLAEAG